VDHIDGFLGGRVEGDHRLGVGLKGALGNDDEPSNAFGSFLRERLS
jgi:hypothetical protein